MPSQFLDKIAEHKWRRRQGRDRVAVRLRKLQHQSRHAKENRSAGEQQARKITAEADHQKVRIEAEAAGAAARISAEGDAEASRDYTAAFGQDPKFYEFLRILQAYEKILDERTALFFPADAELLRMLHFDAQPAPGEPSPLPAGPVGAVGSSQEPNAFSADADRLLKKKSGEELR
jgi:membrane protease subunit HflC